MHCTLRVQDLVLGLRRRGGKHSLFRLLSPLLRHVRALHALRLRGYILQTVLGVPKVRSQ
jgi:hypothetical protein